MIDQTPSEMPEGLERVRTALLVPLEPAPEQLLGRIMKTRATGEARAPIKGSSARTRLLIPAIAASILMTSIGLWSVISHRAQLAAGDTVGDSWESGMVATLAAQTAARPQFPPMQFAGSRLHQAVLVYRARVITDGKQVSEAAYLATSLTRDPLLPGGWILASTSQSPRGNSSVVDSLSLAGDPLKAVRLVTRSNRADGRWRREQFDIRDSVVRLHSTRHGMVTSNDLKRPETYDSVMTIPVDAFPRNVRHSQWIVDLMAVPLAANWRGTMMDFGLSLSMRPIVTNMKVVGEEDWPSGSGSEPCWKVSVQYGDDHSLGLTLLVRKRDGVMVRKSVSMKDEGKLRVLEIFLAEEH